jgi:hypothetical protein
MTEATLLRIVIFVILAVVLVARVIEQDRG